MEIEIKKEIYDKFFGRKNLEVEIKNAATISKEELKKKIAEKFNVNEEKVEVKYIIGKKGWKCYNSKIYIYEA